MEQLLLLLIVPLCWALFSKKLIGHRITWEEVGVQTAVTSLLVILVWAASQYTSMHDTEVFNGYVTSKDKVWVSCSHSYPCNCRTECSGYGENESCSTVCDTCYSHNNDWDWRVYSTVGQLNINRIDSRGSKEPPRWTAVEIGEPFSTIYSYTNYIRAVPETLFVRSVDTTAFADMIPKYPAVYDYYRFSRVINYTSLDKTFISTVNDTLNSELKTLGAKKEANIIVILVPTTDPNYRHALETSWLGGKKNDVIVIIGASAPPVIDWVDVITLGLNSGNEHMRVVLRDEIQDMKLDNPEQLGYTISTIVDKHFSRKPMRDFEYLKDDIKPPTWVLILAMVLSIIANIFLTIYFKDN